ncbi:MAG: 3-oxoacyl-(Acyl-carrier-protein) reductase [candidate division TM6 bacterium GW2011_GWF2_28_16]|nr:MAG: 3-oxoacyl-(Acyl-carrier-protein) reductase [candidate division TM6 bacterium GW2011_GWF2_28_16]
MHKKNSLVTGGASGIGREIVNLLLNRQDTVFVFDILENSDARVLELINLGVNYFNINISSYNSIIIGFENIFKILNTLENKNLNLLVNNAGITRDNLAIRLKEQDWDSVLDINLKGAFFCAQQAIKKFLKQDKNYTSYIINISSIVGIIGNAGQVNYAASKAGLIALTKTLAQEYGSKNILINAIAPGFIQTSLTNKLPEDIKEKILNKISLKRFGQPQDVANLVLFLSSGNADYITGQVIQLDGGLF